jgi:ubiquitin C-terminal hydrolase
LPNAKGEAFVAISRVIAGILKLVPSPSHQIVELLRPLMELAFSTESSTIRSSIFSLFRSHVQNNDAATVQIIRKALDFETDRWNYSPEQQGKYLGLRNLGSTCYMNSIFQQLFHTFPFRYLVVTRETTDEGQSHFKKLFTELLLSKKRYADTQPFCSSWKGWHQELINPREQQDVFEFFQLFLDQLPKDLSQMFSGTIKNSIEGLTGTYSASNIESFYTFPLEIKGLKDVQESFRSSIQSELFTGGRQSSMDDNNNEKIDVRKYLRIETAPPVLVLQLKRFEYDMKTWKRIKVKDRYEFH